MLHPQPATPPPRTNSELDRDHQLQGATQQIPNQAAHVPGPDHRTPNIQPPNDEANVLANLKTENYRKQFACRAEDERRSRVNEKL
jgi:hypothetical protein